MGIEAVLVLLLLLTPGLAADAFYRFLLWRPDPEESVRITRALLFSAAGLLLLFLLAEAFPVFIPRPEYLATAWWTSSWAADLQSTAAITWPWLLHAGASVAVAGFGVLVMKRQFVSNVLRAVAGQSLHRNAWDEFAAAYHKKWVFVKLSDGRHYYGELGVVSADRSKDFVLWHPYPYREEDGVFEITGARALFVPADQISSILVAEATDDLPKLRPLMGLYNVRTGERIDDRREQEPPSGSAEAQQDNAVGAEGKSDEPAKHQPDSAES